MEAKPKMIDDQTTTDTAATTTTTVREDPRPFTALLYFREEVEANETVLRAELGVGLPESLYVYVDKEDDSQNGIREGWNLVWVSIKLKSEKAYARIVKKEDALRYQLECLRAQLKLAESSNSPANTAADKKTVLAWMYAKDTPYTDRQTGDTTIRPIFKYGRGIGGRGGHTVFVHRDATDQITQGGWYLCVLERRALRLKYSFARPYLVAPYIVEIMEALEAQVTRCGNTMAF